MTGFPHATPHATPAAPPEAELHALTPVEQEQLDTLYAQLKPEATAGARAYVLNRTPVVLQVDMTAKIDADWPLPPVTQAAAAPAPAPAPAPKYTSHAKRGHDE